jgi:methionyl-tRNA formyltransferase
VADGSLEEVAQESFLGDQVVELKHAPKIYKDLCKIDWNKGVNEVYNLIRGLSPYPAAFTFLHDKILKIIRTEKINVSPEIPPGEYVTDSKSFLNFSCNNGYIAVKELQLEGKKKMAVEEFLKGFRQPD